MQTRELVSLLLPWLAAGAPLAPGNKMAHQDQGYAAGTDGLYFRYKHLMMEKPKEEDLDSARKVAGEIRCAVCEKTLESLLRKAKTFSEDDIADVLEGDTEYVKTGDAVHDKMMKHKKGCNKHFKDELVAEGWMLRTCKEVAPDYKNDSSPCLWRNTESKPSAQAIDTYEIWKEGLFFACEQSIGRHGDELAEVLASKIHAEPGSVESEDGRLALSSEVCRSTARCDKEATGKKQDAGKKEEQEDSKQTAKAGKKSKAKKKKGKAKKGSAEL
mmetsp:Transcript_94140/g.167442  ORF Transcript_94140/g.167442 Transcript_94140/m.167442 type:complete len:272 (+) Transcript_94140:44-859(+)